MQLHFIRKIAERLTSCVYFIFFIIFLTSIYLHCIHQSIGGYIKLNLLKSHDKYLIAQELIKECHIVANRSDLKKTIGIDKNIKPLYNDKPLIFKNNEYNEYDFKTDYSYSPDDKSIGYKRTIPTRFVLISRFMITQNNSIYLEKPVIEIKI